MMMRSNIYYIKQLKETIARSNIYYIKQLKEEIRSRIKIINRKIDFIFFI
jgi:hypothetical protein